MTEPPLRFRDFELDPTQFALRRAGHRVRLERKPLELLILLVEKRGELVAREEIIQRVWGKGVFFDAERGINNAIRKIRAALHDESGEPHFVETVVGKGYRFIAPINGATAATPSPNVGAALAPAVTDVRADMRRLKRDTDSGFAVVAPARTWDKSGLGAQPGHGVPNEGPPSALKDSSARYSTSGSVVMEVAKQHKASLTAGMLAALMVLAAAGYGVYSLLNIEHAMPFENYTITQATSNGKTIAAAISPDGKYLLSVIEDNGKQSLWLRHVQTNSDTQVIAPADAFYQSPAFSSDGNYIYFRKAIDRAGTGYNLLRAPVLGGTPQVIVRNVDSQIAMSPDGKLFAFTRGMYPEVEKFEILVANTDGTNEKMFAGGPLSAVPSTVAWSPDGKQIASVIPGVGDALSAIQLQEVPSAKAKTLAWFNNRQLNDLVWLPNARGLFATYQQNASPLARSQIAFVSEPTGQFRPITRDTSNYRTLTISADGRTLATVQQKTTETFYAMRAKGFTGSPPNPAPTQNKESIFFGWADNGDLYFDDRDSLLRISADGRNQIKLLSDPTAQILSPSGCQDGRYVIFMWAGHSSNNKVNVWRVDADGSNPKQLTDGSADAAALCTRDGKWVYYDDLNDLQIKRVPVEGGTPEIVPGTVMPATLFFVGLAIAPDGKRLAFLTGTGGVPVHKIALVTLDAGPEPPRRMLDPDPRIASPPQFTPDGNAVVYPIRENGADNLWLQPINGSRGYQITKFQSDAIQIFAFSPDGKTLGVLRSHTESDVVLLHDTGGPPK